MARASYWLAKVASLASCFVDTLPKIKPLSTFREFLGKKLTGLTMR